MTDNAADKIKAHRGFFPVVAGDEVHVEQAGGIAYLSSGDMSLSQGGSRLVVAGGDVSIAQGGSNAVLAGGDVSISQGGGMLVAARSVETDHSYVGVALGGSVTLQDSKVLLDPPAAAALGAGLAIALFLLRKLFGR